MANAWPEGAPIAARENGLVAAGQVIFFRRKGWM